MNYRGSYRRLVGNSKAAMMGAIEIYNKPRFDYRNEVFVQLLVNAWELVLKAIVSKSKRSIYYKKRRGEPYRTLSWSDAFHRSTSPGGGWPTPIPHRPVALNLELVALYRDNAVHFYNEAGFGVVVYSLAQTAISNYRDVLHKAFGQELADEITWDLLPLGVRAPIGPLEYLGGHRPLAASLAVRDFLSALNDATVELEDANTDTARLLTIFDVSLQSTKKIERADIVLGVSGENSDGKILVSSVLDPNKSHPYRMKDVVAKIRDAVTFDFNRRSFEAVAWRHRLRDQRHMCWVDAATNIVKWSPEAVVFVRGLSQGQIEEARAAYSEFLRERQRTVSAA
jgi:hypothetical protein